MKNSTHLSIDTCRTDAQGYQYGDTRLASITADVIEKIKQTKQYSTTTSAPPAGAYLLVRAF